MMSDDDDGRFLGGLLAFGRRDVTVRVGGVRGGHCDGAVGSSSRPLRVVVLLRLLFIDSTASRYAAGIWCYDSHLQRTALIRQRCCADDDWKHHEEQSKVISAQVSE